MICPVASFEPGLLDWKVPPGATVRSVITWMTGKPAQVVTGITAAVFTIRGNGDNPTVVTWHPTVDPAAGTITFDELATGIDPGEQQCDLVVTDANGDDWTILAGTFHYGLLPGE